MNNELSNAIETISTCAESVSELSTALDRYLSSFKTIQKTVSDIQRHEESTADIIDTVSLQISEQIEKTQNWNNEVVPEAVRTLTDLSARTVELTEGTGKELQKSLGILTSAIDELGPIVKEMDGISVALHNVSEKVAELPQLSKVSKEIHNSLGILSGLDELEVISEKLDSKIAAIELEKKELVEPLKNAAKFTEIVKAENVEIHEKIDAVGLTLARENESMQELLATFSMKEPDSFAAKMDYLVTAMVELSSKIDAATAQKFIDNLAIFSLLANVADVKSLVIHPATTTHAQLTEEELADQGIKPNTIRLSIGTEHIDDILEDLEQGFQAVKER